MNPYALISFLRVEQAIFFALIVMALIWTYAAHRALTNAQEMEAAAKQMLKHVGSMILGARLEDLKRGAEKDEVPTHSGPVGNA